MLKKLKRLLSQIAKGFIYGNMVISNGGGIYINGVLN